MEKNYTIRRGEKDFFRAYVEMVRPFLRGIRTREADVFAEILYQNYRRKAIPIEDRFQLIFSKRSREEMTSNLGITTAIFRNALTGLRGRSLVRDDNTVPEAYLVMPENGNFKLSFNFILE